jgi:hypothetical protein
LRKDSALANVIPKEARIYAPDLPDRLRDLDEQKRRLIAAQNYAIQTGDLQRIAYIGDAVARNIRHAAALAEVLRLRQMTPATNFAASDDYRSLRAALLPGLPSPEAVEHAESVLDAFETKTAPPAPDALEALY